METKAVSKLMILAQKFVWSENRLPGVCYVNDLQLHADRAIVANVLWISVFVQLQDPAGLQLVSYLAFDRHQLPIRVL